MKKYHGLQSRQDVGLQWDIKQNEKIYFECALEEEYGYPEWKETIKDYSLIVSDPESLINLDSLRLVIYSRIRELFTISVFSKDFVTALGDDFTNSFWLMPLTGDRFISDKYIAVKEKVHAIRPFKNDKYKEMSLSIHSSFEYPFILEKSLYEKVKDFKTEDKWVEIN